MANLEVRLPEYDQVENRATEIKSKIDDKTREVKAAIEVATPDLSPVAKSSELAPLAKSSEITPLAKSSELANLATKTDVENAKPDLTPLAKSTELATIESAALEAKTAANAAKASAENAATAAGGVAGDAQAAKIAAEHAERAASNVEGGIFETVAATSSIEAKLDTLHQIMAQNRMAKITVRLNAPGTSYSIPASERVRSEILAGAKFVLKEQGVSHPYEAPITSLENFSHTFTVYVTDASEYLFSTALVVLGKSSEAAYAVAAQMFRLKNGAEIVVDLTTQALTGSVVELCRVQPYNASPTSANAKSFIGKRVTDANGTTLHLGHYAEDGTTWVDQSLTKVVIWDCPNGGTPTPRVIKQSTDEYAGGSPDSMDLMETLEVFKNLKLVNLKLAGNNAAMDSNPAVRYQKCYTKHELIYLNLPIANSDGSLRDNMVLCNVDWFCDVQADGDYHPFSLFERYERLDDGSYATIELDHGYIMRYPIGATQNITLTKPDGTTASFPCPRSKAGEGREYVPGTRNVSLNVAKNANSMTATIEAEGEEDVVILPNTDERLFSIAGQGEVTFLQKMAYLFFGVNVQGAASASAPDTNIFPGICSSSVAATTNGATDYIVNQGIWNGAANTKLVTNSIVFLGVEDGLWSSQGWYMMDLTKVNWREIVTDADGTILTNKTGIDFLYCQDRADYQPGTVDITNEIVDDDANSFVYKLLHEGYRRVNFAARTSDGYWLRAGVDDSQVLRDTLLPAADAAAEGINMGSADYYYSGSIPNSIAAFSASTTYAAGKFVTYNGKLYQTKNGHAAGAFNEDFEAVVSGKVTQRNYYKVSLGNGRGTGAHLGIAYVFGNSGLVYSSGANWRARLSLQPCPSRAMSEASGSSL